MPAAQDIIDLGEPSRHGLAAAAGPQGYGKLPYLVFAALVVAELAAILALNGGMLVYSLDDAYIHLALAGRILSGTYGINVHEVAAPASSLLWPFLLAPFAVLPDAVYSLVPWLLNIVSASVTLALLVRTVRRTVTPLSTGSMGVGAALFATGLVLATNLVPLIFIGMEHSLQQLLAVIVVIGLIEEGRAERVSRGTWLALVLLPLIRYDSLALAGPALAYLFWRGHWRGSILAAIAMGTVVGAFSAFLFAHGLGILPASVMAKSEVMRASGAPLALLQNLYANVHGYPQGNILLGGLALVLAAACDSRRPAAERGLACTLSAALVLELSFGKLGGGYFRYEAYVWAATLVALIHLYRGVLARILAPGAPAAPQIAALGGLGAASLTYMLVLTSTSIACNNIYDQQYQMHRFVTAYYRGPVAVNDLGWVAFRNPYYVLDLAGLASREALTARHSESGGDWMDRLARAHGVHLAMIYDDWFPRRPTGWVRVGTLESTQARVTTANSVVSFYATDSASVTAIRAALSEFQQDLPQRVTFRFAPSN